MSNASLSLDISALYLVATFIAAMLGGLLLFFWRQENIAALGWWGAAYLLGAAAIALWTAGGDKLGLPLLLAVNGVGFVACGLVWDAARVFHGRTPVFLGVVAGAVAWVGAMLLFPDMAAQPKMLLGGGIVAAYAALTATELWRERRKAVRARWPAIFVPLLHGTVLMLPIVLEDALGSTNVARSTVGIWAALFAVELVCYAIGTVFIIFMLVTERTVAAHKSAASIDPLTGLLNRRGFGEATSRMIDREAKAGRPISVMIFDIDHFKSVNDRFGHATGDDVLKVFANVVTDSLRVTDLVGRVGGEEFAALLPCALDEAQGVAERVREAFEKAGVMVNEAALATTVSIGIAAGPADTEIDVLMASADAALYRAKRGGRNRVEAIAEQPLSLAQTRLAAKSPPLVPAITGLIDTGLIDTGLIDANVPEVHA